MEVDSDGGRVDPCVRVTDKSALVAEVSLKVCVELLVVAIELLLARVDANVVLVDEVAPVMLVDVGKQERCRVEEDGDETLRLLRCA